MELPIDSDYVSLFSRPGTSGYNFSHYFLSSRVQWLAVTSGIQGVLYYSIPIAIDYGEACLKVHIGPYAFCASCDSDRGTVEQSYLRPVVDIKLSDTILGQDGAGTIALPYLL